MKPNVEPSLLHVSTHKRIRVYPIFFSRRELTNETTMTTSTKKDSKTEQHQATSGSSTTPSRCHNRRSN
ncbi:unnamed protein product [Brassica napus]|uniref:(rape) hypothetical protein n=1 Tax=Brassica napus TaxID=3708 RepID=A0A816NEG4_BRANA|nr:unnamed protein product [Brassica napus]